MGSRPRNARADSLPRARCTHGCRHRTGADGSHPGAVRSSSRGTRSTCASRREHRHDLRGVRRCGREPRSRRRQPLRLRSRGCGRDLGTCPARVVSPGGARLSAHVDPPRDVHRRGVRDRAGLGSRCPRPGRAERASDASRAPGHHGDRRNDIGSLGARVHPVVRGRQEALRGRPALRADRCRHRCGDDRSDRVLRRRHMRGHALINRGHRSTTRGTLPAPSNRSRDDSPPSSSAPAFSGPPSSRLRSCRSQRRTRSAKCSGRRPSSTTGSAKLPSSTGRSRSSSSPPVRSCSSPGRRLSQSSISHRR